VQKEREHGGKAAVWMNVERGEERERERERAWRGENVWDEAMGFIQEKIPGNKPMSEDIKDRGNMYCTATQNDRRSS
jgi:hypothetical protein